MTETRPSAGEPTEQLVHGTAVAISGAGVLLRGASGSGKSDLALRLIDQGAVLVSDDQSVLQRQGPDVFVSAPAKLAGKLEVRGIGIVRMPDAGSTRLRMVVDLVPSGDVDRLPERRTAAVLGVDIPCLRLNPGEHAAPIKLKLALSHPHLN